MDNCESCEDGHVFTMSFSSQSVKALEKLATLVNNSTTGGHTAFKLDSEIRYQRIEFDGIVERCDHGELQDCEECDSVRE